MRGGLGDGEAVGEGLMAGGAVTVSAGEAIEAP
jgi:hypothetical protein